MSHTEQNRRAAARTGWHPATGLLLALLLVLLPGGGRSGAGPEPDDWARPGLVDSLFTGRHLTLPGAPDPHRHGEACAACHREGRTSSADSVDPARCLNCHDRRAHDIRIHAVGVLPPSAGSVSVPAHLPLENGALGCLTCHGAVCDPPRGDPSALRGGPRTRPERFCFQCHQEGAFTGLYPHGRGGKDPAPERLSALGLESTCRVCHHKDPAPETAADRWVSTRTLCQRCHSGTTHEARHLGQVLADAGADGEIRDRLASFEQASGYTLPRDEGGRMDCITCHLPSSSCRPAGETGELPAHGLRLPAGLLCLACHAPDAAPRATGGAQR